MIDFDEKSIEILSYNCKGDLPNPFLFDNGSSLKSPEEWKERRKEIYKTAIELQYGTQPPAPEFVDVELLYIDRSQVCCYRITSGKRSMPVSFLMYLFKAKNTNAKAPAVISGDMCFVPMYDKEFISQFTENGIHFVSFNRVEIAADIAGYALGVLDKDTYEYKKGTECVEKNRDGISKCRLKEAYSECSFGTVGAWAWGYSRCVDALEILQNTDMNLIAFTGLSRGAKACALAGAIDERAAIVNPCATCAGGNSGYRIKITAKTEDGRICESEEISNIFRHFPTWMGQDMKQYIDNEEKLPFDSHYLKALVAPRILFVAEAASDIMANPVGSWQTTMAAGEVYKFLGCEENLYWYFRSGGHNQTIEDVQKLVNIIRHVRDGEPINNSFYKLPFKPMKLSYSWKCPE